MDEITMRVGGIAGMQSQLQEEQALISILEHALTLEQKNSKLHAELEEHKPKEPEFDATHKPTQWHKAPSDLLAARLFHDREVKKQARIATNMVISGVPTPQKYEKEKDLRKILQKIFNAIGATHISAFSPSVVHISRIEMFKCRVGRLRVVFQDQKTKTTVMRYARKTNLRVRDVFGAKSEAGDQKVDINHQMTPYFAGMLHSLRIERRKGLIYGCWLYNEPVPAVKIKIKPNDTEMVIENLYEMNEMIQQLNARRNKKWKWLYCDEL